MHAYMLSHFSCIWLCETLCTVACQVLCPRDSPGKNTVVGCHALLQGIFLIQRLNPHLLQCRGILYMEPRGSPLTIMLGNENTEKKRTAFSTFYNSEEVDR